MKIPTKEIGEVVETLLQNPKALKVVKFLSDKRIVRAVRKAAGSASTTYVSLTIGHPNYSEREIVAFYKKTKRFQNGMALTKFKTSKKKVPSRK